MPAHSLPLKPFDTPKTVTIEMPPGLRQEGMRALPTLQLCELSRETIMEMCAEFTSRVLTEYDHQLTTKRRNDESMVLAMNRGA